MARIGRPAKTAPATGGGKVSLGLKVTPEIKNRLDTAARLAGRTQSQEAEVRLERSFERQNMLLDVLTTKYGSQIAGLLMLAGEAFLDAWFIAMLLRGDDRESVADALLGGKEAFSMDDPGVYKAAAVAVGRILMSMPPAAPTNEESERVSTEIGERVADALIAQLTNPTDVSGKPAGEIRRLLGPVAPARRSMMTEADRDHASLANLEQGSYRAALAKTFAEHPPKVRKHAKALGEAGEELMRTLRRATARRKK